MSDVPSQAFQEILRRLPAESLLRFRAVCKSWRRHIDNPSFIKSHSQNQTLSTTLLIRNSIGTRHYSLPLDSLNYTDGADQTINLTPVRAVYRAGVPRVPVLPVPSCNGLILNSHYGRKKPWVIWNPLTREFHELPEIEIEIETCLSAIGIGYDSVSNDYKVVRIDRLYRENKSVNQTCVYSLKTDSWMMIKDFPYDVSSFSMFPNRGVFLNGALHWLSAHDIVVAMVLGTGKYIEFSMPVLPPNSGEPFDTRLDVLGGCLVMSYYYLITRMDGWIMKDYGVDKSWVKLFSFGQLDMISAMGSLRPIAYFKNRGHVFLQHNDEFFWLDVVNNSAKKVIIQGLPDNFSSQIVPGSLFRLDESCAAVVKYTTGMKRKRIRNKADAREEHSVRITDIWTRSDSTPKASWLLYGGDDYY